MVGCLGDVVFNVSGDYLLTPESISGSTGAEWAKHDSLHGKSASEYIGPKLKSYKIPLTLDARFGVPPRRTLETLQAMAEGSGVYWFVIGGRPVGDHPYKLHAVSDSWDNVLNDGALLQCKVSLELEEYV